MKTFRIRRLATGKPSKAVSVLTVPAEIARQLPPEIEYVCELMNDGILYRPVGRAEDAPVILPDWARPT